MTLSLERSPDWPSINDFYARKDIFITGASGFLGKCLVEKLLRDVPDIGRIMILLRPKRDKSVEERLQNVFASKCFERVKEYSPEALDKVVAIAGNISDPGLGIGQEDAKTIKENVSVVFHLAATVKFDAPLRESLSMNVGGVKELIKLCRDIRKLEALVHISTAFAHCNRTELIEEVIYPLKIQPDKVLSLLDWMTDEQLDSLTPTMLEGRPNTYTYTKALAESVLQSDAQGLPLTIIRPSIVTSGSKEPFPGWVDCWHGATGLVVAIGKGILRVLRIQKKGIADFVPVDLLNNVIISAAWMTGVAKPTQPVIYQYTSGNRNPMNWIELYPLVINSYTSKPFDEIFRRPYVFKCRPACAWKCWHFLLHLIPGFFADLMLRIQGKKPRMMKTYRKLEAAILQLDYFTQNYWDWSYANCEKLQSLLSDEDKEKYDFDITKLVWGDYIPNLTMGTKMYLMKEDPANLPIARRQITRLRNIRYTINVAMLLVATRLLYIKSRIARELWSSMLGFCIQAIIKLSRFLMKQ